MKKISNLSELNDEIKTLNSIVREKESKIRNSVNDLKESMLPSRLFFRMLSALMKVKYDEKDFQRGSFRRGWTVFRSSMIDNLEKKMQDKAYNILDEAFISLKHFIDKLNAS